MVELAAQSLALQLGTDLVILKYSHFLWNLMAGSTQQKCPRRKRREEEEVYG